MDSAPIIENLKGKQAVNATATPSKDSTMFSKPTATTVEATATPARTTATPAKDISTKATPAKVISPKVTATSGKTIAVTAKANTSLTKNKAKPTKSTVTPAKATTASARPKAAPTAAPVTIMNSTNGLSVCFDTGKAITSAYIPVNKKRGWDAEDSFLEEAAPDTPKATLATKAGNTPKSATSSAAKNGSNRASPAKGKAPASKVATRPKLVASNSVSSTAEPLPKRTKAFKSRRGPSFQAAEALNASISNDVPMEFSTTCYYVQLGDVGQTYFVHEHHLSKSPRLLDEVRTAKSKCRKTQQQIIQLLPHDAGAFGQLVGYLYSDQFKTLDCNKGNKMLGHRMKEFHEVMSLAKYYNMPGLQKEIMRVVSKDRLVHRVSVAAFFDWAEDMWYEEMDKKNGPFAKYLQRHAPAMLRSASEKDLKGMMKFIGEGGDYVKQLFVASHKAIALSTTSIMKSELESNYE